MQKKTQVQNLKTSLYLHPKLQNQSSNSAQAHGYTMKFDKGSSLKWKNMLIPKPANINLHPQISKSELQFSTSTRIQDEI
jgi:hypothetical protein